VVITFVSIIIAVLRVGQANKSELQHENPGCRSMYHVTVPHAIDEACTDSTCK
jgi:hypothetical protein